MTDIDTDDGIEPLEPDTEPDDTDEPELPPVIEPLPVAGAEGLPDDVRNGEIEHDDEGESHPSVDHEPIIEPREG